jgi:hypothetical protein
VKILLDENLDRRLRGNLGSHEVFTVRYLGWHGLKNGQLLRVAEEAAFDVLLTGDRSLYHEQNLFGRRLAIVELSSVEWRIIGKQLAVIVAAIEKATPGSFQSVDCGTFSRKRLADE